MKALGLCEYFRVEDFWIRATLELQEGFKERDAESIEKLSFLERYLRKFVHKSRLYKLLSIFLLLQILLIYISQTCWLISEMVFSNRCIRRLLMGSTSEDELFTLCEMGGPENHDDPRVGRPGNTDDGGVEEPENHDDPGVGRPGNTDDGGVGSSSQVPRDFERYSKLLMHMLAENLAAVWIANKKSINDMKAEQQNGGSHGKDCEALISLLLRRRRDLGFTDPFPIS